MGTTATATTSDLTCRHPITPAATATLKEMTVSMTSTICWVTTPAAKVRREAGEEGRMPSPLRKPAKKARPRLKAPTKEDRGSRKQKARCRSRRRAEAKLWRKAKKAEAADRAVTRP